MQLSRSPKRAAVIGGTMLLACLVGLKLAAQSGDPLISALLGSWKLNVATSKLPGPPPQSSVGRIERTDDGFFKHIQDEVDAQGKAVHYETSAKLDGKDYPTQGSQPPVTRAYKRVDDRTLEVTVKRDGNIIAVIGWALSPDGKSLTAAVGSQTIQIYEKQ